jgi:hypothetical protein
MKKTVREWIEFLNMGSNHYIGLEMENGIRCKDENYIPAPKCMEEFDGWLDFVVTKAYIINWEKNGNYYHLLIYTV